MDDTQNGSAGEKPGLGQLPPGYDGLAEARRLLRTIRAGALGTLTGEGFPFSSLVNVATAMDGAPILLMSGLSGHTRHLLADTRASLLLAESGKGDPLAHPRLTLVGRAVRIEDEAQRLVVRARFLARHPKSALYADFGDFAFWRFEIVRGHLNGGFAKAAEYAAAELLLTLEGTEELAAIEPGALEHLNADHSDAVQLYAQRLLGEPAGRWRATGIDPTGLDMALGDRTTRLVFPARVVDGAGLRQTLAECAARARAMAQT